MKHSNHVNEFAYSYVEFPDYASLAALRAWYEGLSARAVVSRYLPHIRAQAQSSRGIIGRIRRRLIDIAEANGRNDIAAVFADQSTDHTRASLSIHRAIETLRELHGREPQINDDIGFWLSKRANRALKTHGITTLAELTLRVPRRHRWWTGIVGIGPAMARDIEAFFSQHPKLTDVARQLVERIEPRERFVWRQIVPVRSRNGSNGKYRAPKARCLLDATTDRQSLQTGQSRAQ